jgi:mono/diheme cytochrome c family protein
VPPTAAPTRSGIVTLPATITPTASALPSVMPTSAATPTPLPTATVAAPGAVGAAAPAAVAPALVAQGQAVYQAKACYVCHTINGRGGATGPDLSHIASQPYDQLPNAADFLSKWLVGPHWLSPSAAMPRPILTDQEVAALVAYLQSLK